MSYAPIGSKVSLLPTYEVFPEDDEELLIKLTDTYVRVATSTNMKEIAVYDTVQQSSGQLYFNQANAQQRRTGYRKVFPFGAIATGAILTIPHGLTRVTIFTRIYGSCVTNVIDYRPIPYVNEALVTNQISIRASATNIFIANGATAPAITSGIAVLEYLFT